MKRFLFMAVALLFVLVGGFALLTYTAIYGVGTYHQQPVSLFISSGSTFEDVYEQVQEKGFLKDHRTFHRVSLLKKYDKAVKPGHYVVKPKSSVNEIVNMLRAGNQTPVNLTFNDLAGLDLLAGKLAQQLEADSLSFFRVFSDDSVAVAHGFDAQTFAAMFLPNTYEMYWTVSPAHFVERMQREYQGFWTEARLAKARSIGLSPVEVATLASIVESETAKREEMPTVAGLYINRLKRGEKLQSDPTVWHSLKMGGYDISERRRLLYADLDFDSPYNTYIYKGLPPGPIRVVHPSTIDATLNFENHNYLFMCADPERPGYHNFARTHVEHNRNRLKYQEWLRQNRIMR